MRIADVKTTLLVAPIARVAMSGERAARQRDVILVEAIGDDGATGLGFLTGLGEAQGSEAPVIKTVIDQALKPILVGEDPFNTERLWMQMYIRTRRFGRKGAVVRAISGVDIALWDLIGKQTRTPVHRLLGGFRDTTPAYVSGGHYFEGATVDDLVEEVRGHVARGARAVKIRVGRATEAEDLRRVRAVRDAVSEDVSLMVDANCAWDRPTATRICRRLDDLGLWWIEEPLAPDDVDGYARLAREVSTPIAAGENEYTRYGFKELIAREAVDIVQPDVTRVGGISEWIKVAAMASAWGIPCAPHGVQEIHCSLVAAVSNGLILEFFAPDHPQHEFMASLFTSPHEAKELVDGSVRAPRAPGLGLEVDRALASRHLAPAPAGSS